MAAAAGPVFCLLGPSVEGGGEGSSGGRVPARFPGCTDAALFHFGQNKRAGSSSQAKRRAG